MSIWPIRAAVAALLLFAASVVLALPRLPRHDYSGVETWRISGGSYFYNSGLPPIQTDAAGVRVVDVGGEIGTVHSPLAVAQYAIGLSEDLSDPVRARAFRTQVEWLERNAVRDGRRGAVWESRFNWPPNGLRAPWVSAMQQGAVLSVLCRAFRASGDSAYLRLAAEGLAVFEIEEDRGGVRKSLGAGVVVLQDFPTERYVVLDGWLNGLGGVLELYLLTGDPRARRILDDGLGSLKRLLPQFYSPLSVYYSSRGDLPSPELFASSYNALRFLATHDAELRPVVEEWREMTRSGFWAKYARVYYQALNWRLMPFRPSLYPRV